MSSVCYSRFKSYLKQLFIRNKLCSSSWVSNVAADRNTSHGNPLRLLFTIQSTIHHNFKITEHKERIILQVCGHDLSQVFTIFLNICWDLSVFSGRHFQVIVCMLPVKYSPVHTIHPSSCQALTRGQCRKFSHYIFSHHLDLECISKFSDAKATL